MPAAINLSHRDETSTFTWSHWLNGFICHSHRNRVLSQLTSAISRQTAGAREDDQNKADFLRLDCINAIYVSVGCGNGRRTVIVNSWSGSAKDATLDDDE